jgi:hypothetical protein
MFFRWWEINTYRVGTSALKDFCNLDKESIEQLTGSGLIVATIKRETRSRIDQLRKYKAQIHVLSVITTDDCVVRFILFKKSSANVVYR